MQDNYIVRQSNDRLTCFFSSNESSILYRTYENDKWSVIKELLTDTLDKFTVTVAQNGTIYIFCQNLDGDIVLCTCDENLGEWSSKIILKNHAEKNHTILFHPIMRPNGLCILYNAPSPDGNFQLVSQNLDDSGSWTSPAPIDDIAKSKGTIFEVQHVTSEHLLVFYQSSRSENNIGYREVTSNKWSDFKPIHLTSYQILDTSFMTTNGSIHALYVVKSMFAHQILYRQKTAEGFSAPLVIWEGQKMENCLLFIANNVIYATFRYRSQMFISHSKNNGKSFSRPETYKNKLSSGQKKAIYISELPMSENEFFARELYVDDSKPWDIQILPKIYEQFYPKKLLVKKPPVQRAASVTPSSNAASANNINAPDNLELKKLQQEIKNKEEQIAYMATIITNYKSQKEDMDLNKTSIETKYSEDIQKLKSKIKELEASDNDSTQLNELQDSNKTLEFQLRELRLINSNLTLQLQKSEELTKTLEDKLKQQEADIEATLTASNAPISTDVDTDNTDDRIITIQSSSPSVLIPYKRLKE